MEVGGERIKDAASIQHCKEAILTACRMDDAMIASVPLHQVNPGILDQGSTARYHSLSHQCEPRLATLNRLTVSRS